MTKLTGVGFVLSLGHNSPEGVRHGHSYDVTVWYRFGHDARALQRQMEAVRQTLNDTLVPDTLQLAENLAEHIARELPGCVAVDCNRPLERIYARWEAAAIADRNPSGGDVKQAPLRSNESGGGEANRTDTPCNQTTP